MFKNYHDMEKDCKQVLENIIATTSKVYLESERNLISNIDVSCRTADLQALYSSQPDNMCFCFKPNLCHVPSESGESDDHEQEIKDLLSSGEIHASLVTINNLTNYRVDSNSAEWPIDNVFKQFYPKMFTKEDEVNFGDADCQTKSNEGCNVDGYESGRDDGAGGDFEPLHCSDPSLSGTNLDLFKGELKELQSMGPRKG